MIRVPPADLPPEAARSLAEHQAAVDTFASYAERVAAAKARFEATNRKENPAFRAVRQALDGMCHGPRRCMYCEDSAADEVEHFRPKDLYPEVVFAWSNYLYACGPCNGPKNKEYERAYHTIDVLDLNGAKGREYLPKARAEEYEARCAILGQYISQKKAGLPPEALDRKRSALGRRGHPTVWAEMKRQHPRLTELRALFSEAPEALAW
jgi:hypothetical protein